MKIDQAATLIWCITFSILLATNVRLKYALKGALLAQTEADKPIYIEKMNLNEICWVRALDALNVIRTDPSIRDARMVLGTEGGHGHAWIEYRRDHEVIQFDPTTAKVISIKRSKGKCK